MINVNGKVLADRKMKCLLSAARGYIQLAMENSLCDDLPGSYLKIAMEEIEDLTGVINDYLSQTYPRAESMRVTDVNSLLSGVLLLMDNVTPKSDISVQRRLSGGIPTCILDAEQVKEALLNVFINALQAMPEGGLLTVNTSYSIQDKEICISVADTGEGIPPENLDRVFSPFFSTRSEGLGLGLTLTNRIIEYHNGRVILRSIVGKGTTVYLYLPAQLKLDFSLQSSRVGMTVPMRSPHNPDKRAGNRQKYMQVLQRASSRALNGMK